MATISPHYVVSKSKGRMCTAVMDYFGARATVEFPLHAGPLGAKHPIDPSFQ